MSKFTSSHHSIMVTDAGDGFQERIGIRMVVNSSIATDDEVSQKEVRINLMQGGKG